MSTTILADKDVNVNAPQTQQTVDAKQDIQSMEYHRQILQSKLAGETDKQTYVSPSDDIMSPCTAKLNAYRHKHVSKVKPKSLFAKTSSKNYESSQMFADKPAEPKPEDNKS